MNFSEALENTGNTLKRTREEIIDLRALLKILEDDEERLSKEYESLVSVAQRYNLTVEQDSAIEGADVVPIRSDISVPNTPRAVEITTLSRNDAVLEVLSNSSVALDRSQISELLEQCGRSESLDDISLSLSGLKRRSRVENVSRGKWIAIPA